MSWHHLVGIGGSGMLPLAELLLKKGYRVSGSDRLMDQPERLEHLSSPLRTRFQRLQSLGADLVAQDGSGVHHDTQTVVISTAIEEDNPDILAARRLGIPVIHRAEALSNQVKSERLLAIAGTSGKSTTAALCGWILKTVGKLDCFVGGAEILDGEEGSAVHIGGGDWSCLELDESDRSILRFHPHDAVILNITKDHHSYEENIEIFHQFARQVDGTLLLKRHDPGCLQLAERLQHSQRIAWYDFPSSDPIEFTPTGMSFAWGGLEWKTSLWGKHNAENIAAAVGLIQHTLPDLSLQEIQSAVQHFPGTRRRLQRYRPACPAVVDDYAHNPEKIKALLTTLQHVYRQVCLIFQPHGYSPLRFHLEEFAVVFQEGMRDSDALILLPVYDAGGTTTRNITSQDLKEKIQNKAVIAAADREEAIAFLHPHQPPFEAIAVAGARDDTLAEFARQIADRFHSDEVCDTLI